MSDPDHERSAAICRQAALPMLRQRLDMVVPKAPDGEAACETAPAPAPGPARTVSYEALDFSLDLWLRIPR